MCGLEDGGPACEPKGRRFNSQLGNMPGLQAMFSSEGRAIGNHNIDVSLPLFLPPFSSLKINKSFKKNLRQRKIGKIYMFACTDMKELEGR